MRTIVFLCLMFLVSGCSLLSKPMTRLVPKIEMHSPPEELMKAPLPLKTIVPSQKDAAPAPK